MPRLTMPAVTLDVLARRASEGMDGPQALPRSRFGLTGPTILAVTVLALLCGGCATALPPHAGEPVGRAYLLRGQGWVFSGGWATLAGELRAAGWKAADLSDHGAGAAEADILADRAAGRARGPLALVGHSRGGRQCIDLARRLGERGVTVDLLVTVDVAFPDDVPINVRRALNVYLKRDRLYPAAPLRAAPGGATVIENIALDGPASPVPAAGQSHVTLTDHAPLRAFLLGRLLATTAAR
jgi:hypothetical protein